MLTFEKSGDGGSGYAGEHARHRFEHRHFEPARARNGCNLEADVAGADDDRVRASLQHRADAARIVDRAKLEDAAEGCACDRQRTRTRARREHQMVIANAAAVADRNGAALPVDGARRGRELQIDAVLAVPGVGFETETFGSELALEELLGERRPLVRSERLVADEHDVAVVAPLAKRERDLGTGLAGADDDGTGHRIADRGSCVAAWAALRPGSRPSCWCNP